MTIAHVAPQAITTSEYDALVDQWVERSERTINFYDGDLLNAVIGARMLNAAALAAMGVQA